MQIKNVLIKISLHNYAAGGQVMSRRGLHKIFRHHDEKNPRAFSSSKNHEKFYCADIKKLRNFTIN